MNSGSKARFFLIITVMLGLIGSIIMWALTGVSLHYHPKPPIAALGWYMLFVGPIIVPVFTLMGMWFSRSERARRIFGNINFGITGLLILAIIAAMVFAGGRNLGNFLLAFIYPALVFHTARLMRP